MGYAATPASLEQGRRNLRGVLDILNLLWLDARPDIEEDLPVPGQPSRRATTSRALAQTIHGLLTKLLARLTDAEAASEPWVQAHRERVQGELKSYESVFQRGRPLFAVSLPLPSLCQERDQKKKRLGADFAPRFALYKLYEANRAELAVRFTIPMDEDVPGLEITRRIYLALRDEVGSAPTSPPVLASLLFADRRRRSLKPLNTIITGGRGPLQPERTYRRRSAIASSSTFNAEHKVSRRSTLTSSQDSTHLI